MTHDDVPQFEKGIMIHVNYQMGESSVVPMHGNVVECNTTFVAIHHAERSNFLTSFLWWDRVVSIHVLKEQGHDRAGETVREGTYPGTPEAGRPGR